MVTCAWQCHCTKWGIWEEQYRVGQLAWVLLGGSRELKLLMVCCLLLQFFLTIRSFTMILRVTMLWSPCPKGGGDRIVPVLVDFSLAKFIGGKNALVRQYESASWHTQYQKCHVSRIQLILFSFLMELHTLAASTPLPTWHQKLLTRKNMVFHPTYGVLALSCSRHWWESWPSTEIKLLLESSNREKQHWPSLHLLNLSVGCWNLM